MRNTSKSLRHFSFLIILALSLALLHPEASNAAPTGTGSRSVDWEYPELTVTPRASERLEREAAIEAKSSLLRHWSVELPATGLITAGLLQLAQPYAEKDPDHQAAITGISVGAAWWIGTWLLHQNYRPYTAGTSEIAVFPKQNTRDQLARERAAEQAIDAAGRLAARLKWISFFSTGATSAYLISQARPDSAAKISAGLSLLLSATPLIFEHPWSEVARQQQDYKKRIFGPVASMVVIQNSSARLSPGLALQWKW